MSLPEVLLWRLLRPRPHGVKFRRQHPIGDYVCDFFCAEQRLIVEIDGSVHDMGDRPERDIVREARLRKAGYDIVRIPAADVLRDAAGIADSLVRLCAAKPPPSGLRPATSPRGGGFAGVPR